MAQEKQFENRVKRYLNDRGHWQLKYWGGGPYTKTGIPDLLCCISGQFVAIELKGPHGRPRDEQLVELRNIESAGGLALLLYPDDWEIFQDIVLEIEANPDSACPDNWTEATPVRRWHEWIRKRGIKW